MHYHCNGTKYRRNHSDGFESGKWFPEAIKYMKPQVKPYGKIKIKIRSDTFIQKRIKKIKNLDGLLINDRKQRKAKDYNLSPFPKIMRKIIEKQYLIMQNT